MSQPSVTAAGSGGDFFLGMERGSCAVRAARRATLDSGVGLLDPHVDAWL
jgi:hypothetical protein